MKANRRPLSVWNLLLFLLSLQYSQWCFSEDTGNSIKKGNVEIIVDNEEDKSFWQKVLDLFTYDTREALDQLIEALDEVKKERQQILEELQRQGEELQRQKEELQKSKKMKNFEIMENFERINKNFEDLFD